MKERGYKKLIAVAIASVTVYTAGTIGLKTIVNSETKEERIPVQMAYMSIDDSLTTATSDSVSVGVETQKSEEYLSGNYSTKVIRVTEEDLKYDEAEEIQAVLDLVNEYRRQAGVEEVVLDETLTLAASTRAKEIASLFSHMRPNGKSCFTVLDDLEAEYWCAGENLAYGQRHADWVMSDWMESKGHKANILYKDYTKLGIGLYQGKDGVLYWVQMFAG